MRKFMFAAMLLGAATASSAAELVVTDAGASKGGRSLALDVSTEGDVTAMQFAIRFPGQLRSVSTKACLADLPATHTGKCVASAEKGMVAVVIWSADNTPLPKGVQWIGRLTVQESAAKIGAGAIQVEKLHMTSAEAQGIDATASVIAQ